MLCESVIGLDRTGSTIYAFKKSTEVIKLTFILLYSGRQQRNLRQLMVYFS